MSKKLIGLFVGVIVFNSMMSSNSFAQGSAKNGNGIDFHSEVEKLSSACADENCEKPYSKSELFHYMGNQQQLSAGLKKILERVSFKQAQIWGDTILEGDYAAEGNTRLDKVVSLYKNNELIGYLITYSEKAWDTSNCLYDGIDDATLIGCTEGRIIESSYVSLNFKEYFYDSKTMAVFK